MTRFQRLRALESLPRIPDKLEALLTEGAVVVARATLTIGNTTFRRGSVISRGQLSNIASGNLRAMAANRLIGPKAELERSVS
jgi:hypothetical protein